MVIMRNDCYICVNTWNSHLRFIRDFCHFGHLLRDLSLAAYIWRDKFIGLTVTLTTAVYISLRLAIADRKTALHGSFIQDYGTFNEESNVGRLTSWKASIKNPIIIIMSNPE